MFRRFYFTFLRLFRYSAQNTVLFSINSFQVSKKVFSVYNSVFKLREEIMKRLAIGLFLILSISAAASAATVEFKDEGFTLEIPTNYTFMNNDGDLMIQTDIPGIAFGLEKSSMPWKDILNGTAEAYIMEGNLLAFKTSVVTASVVTNNGIAFHTAEIMKYSPKNPDVASEVFIAYFQVKKGVYRLVFETSSQFYPGAVSVVKSFLTGISKF